MAWRLLRRLTRAVDPQEAALYIDKFGQQTTVPQDPAYILEGKGFPLYKADALGAALESTPATLKSMGLKHSWVMAELSRL